MTRIRYRRHLGSYNPVTVALWAFLIALLVVPVLVAVIAGAGVLAMSAIGLTL